MLDKMKLAELINNADLPQEEIRKLTGYAADEFMKKLKSGEIGINELMAVCNKAGLSLDELKMKLG